MKKRTKKAKTNSRGNVIRLGRVNIHLTNRWLYTFIVLGILAIIGVGVWAATYSPSGAGHPYTEISTCGANKILKMNAAGTAWTCGDDVAGGGISGSGTANYIAKWTGTGSLGNSIIYDNGNVGIGTTSPGAKLGVAGTDVVGIKYIKSGSKDARIQLGDPGKTWSMAVGWATQGDFSIIEEGVAGDRLYIKQGGNVGIGTSSPTAKLHVTGRLRLSEESIWVNAIDSLGGISIPSSSLFPCSASNRGEIVFFSYKDFTDFLCYCGLRRGAYYWNCPA